jgi:DNA-binding Lrp family transcriptional regulator
LEEPNQLALEKTVVEEKAKEAKPKQRKKRAASGKKKKFKLTKFDKDLLSLVHGGESAVAELRKRLGVDAAEFSERVKKLGEEGLVLNPAGDWSAVTLSVAGYNSLKPRLPKQAVQQSAQESAEARLQANAETLVAQETQLQEEAKTAETQSSLKREVQGGGKTVDVFELIEKYGPEKELVEVRGSVKPEAKLAPELSLEEKFEKGKKARSRTGMPLVIEEKERCELCRAEFKIGVGIDARPKYGHCFCGAAYHKDCYEAQSQETGTCVRCGKRLKIIMGKKSEEALKGMKRVFD